MRAGGTGPERQPRRVRIYTGGALNDVVPFDSFTQQVNSRFRLQLGPGAAIDLELVAATASPAPPQYESFALVFRGPAHPRLPQATYRLQHDTLGELAIFIVPIRQDKGGLYYEAVFNRSRP